MRQSLGCLLVASLALGPAAGFAQAVTIADLVKLKDAGLTDDILVALIESDGSKFTLTANDIIEIRRQGLSERVILAMLKTAVSKVPAQAPPRDIARPQVPSTDPRAVVQTGEIRTGEVPVQEPDLGGEPPVVINVTQKVEQRVETREVTRTEYVPVAVPVAVPVQVRRPPDKPAAPIYWGYGGQRRPDTWKDKDSNRQKDR